MCHLAMKAGIVCLFALCISLAVAQEKIAFKNVPSGKPYKTEIYDDDGIAMVAWYSATKRFIKIVGPTELPVESVYQYIVGEKEFEMPDTLHEILALEYGFIACIIFGLLFIIIVPIVGLFFCLCRLCGNCGGKMVQAQNDSLEFRRRIYLLLVFVTFALMGIAVVCMYSTNEKMGKSIPESHKTIIMNIDDSQTFINNTYTQLRYIVYDSFDIAVEALFATLDGIKDTLGVGIKNAFAKEYRTEKAFQDARSAATDAQKVLDKVLIIVDDSKILETNLTARFYKGVDLLTKQLATWKIQYCPLEKIKPICDKLSFIEINELSKINFNIDKHVDDIREILNKELVSYVDLAEKEFNRIPIVVEDNTESIRADVKQTITDIRNKIRNSKELDQVEDIKNTILNVTNDVKVEINNSAEKVQEYEGHRWWIGVGVCFLVSICVGLILLGMCFGVLGHKTGALPTQRSALSNYGGLSLMAAVGFMFTFASLLMIVTTAFFLVGAHGEAFLCDVMYNNFELLDTIKDLATKETVKEPFIKEMKISEVLSNCKDNQPAYEALNLKKHFNITKLKGLIDRNKIDNEINSFSIDIRKLDVLPPELEKYLKQYSDGVNINFKEISAQLKETLTTIPLNEYQADLRNRLKTIIDVNEDKINEAKVKLEEYKDEVEKILGVMLPDIEKLREVLYEVISKQEVDLSNLHEKLQVLIADLLKTKDRIINGALDIIKAEIHKYKDILLDQVDEFIDYLSSQAEREVAKCLPLWNVYASARHVICRLILDPFNGFWFGLGWCLAFFIPAIIFSVMLSRHFRKMRYTEFEGVGFSKIKVSDKPESAAETQEEPGEEMEMVQSGQKKKWKPKLPFA